MKLEIEVGAELFKFSSFDNWCDTAKRKFSKAGFNSYSAVCIDAKGRICNSGAEFDQAKRDGAFPVRVYAIKPRAAEGETKS